MGRIAMANVLTAGMKGMQGITPPWVAPQNRHVYYLYPVRVDRERLGLSRAQLVAALTAEGMPVAEGYVRPIYLYPMYDSRVAAQKSGLGAGIWHPASDSPARYKSGLCPVTEKMHFEEIFTTNICRADLTEEDARDFLRALEKAIEHRGELRATLESKGIR